MIKFAISVAVSFVAGALLAPEFKPFSLAQEKLFLGSIAGVDACMTVNSSRLIDDKDSRKFCILEQQMGPFSGIELTGRSSISDSGVEGTLTNDSKRNVVTRVLLFGLRYDDEGNETISHASADVWIMPGGDAEFLARFEDESLVKDWGVKWCDNDTEKEQLRSCKTWGISGAYILRI